MVERTIGENGKVFLRFSCVLLVEDGDYDASDDNDR